MLPDDSSSPLGSDSKKLWQEFFRGRANSGGNEPLDPSLFFSRLRENDEARESIDLDDILMPFDHLGDSSNNDNDNDSDTEATGNLDDYFEFNNKG